MKKRLQDLRKGDEVVVECYNRMRYVAEVYKATPYLIDVDGFKFYISTGCVQGSGFGKPLRILLTDDTQKDVVEHNKAVQLSTDIADSLGRLPLDKLEAIWEITKDA